MINLFIKWKFMSLCMTEVKAGCLGSLRSHAFCEQQWLWRGDDWLEPNGYTLWGAIWLFSVKGSGKVSGVVHHAARSLHPSHYKSSKLAFLTPCSALVSSFHFSKFSLTLFPLLVQNQNLSRFPLTDPSAIISKGIITQISIPIFAFRSRRREM